MRNPGRRAPARARRSSLSHGSAHRDRDNARAQPSAGRCISCRRESAAGLPSPSAPPAPQSPDRAIGPGGLRRRSGHDDRSADRPTGFAHSRGRTASPRRRGISSRDCREFRACRSAKANCEHGIANSCALIDDLRCSGKGWARKIPHTIGSVLLAARNDEIYGADIEHSCSVGLTTSGWCRSHPAASSALHPPRCRRESDVRRPRRSPSADRVPARGDCPTTPPARPGCSGSASQSSTCASRREPRPLPCTWRRR